MVFRLYIPIFRTMGQLFRYGIEVVMGITIIATMTFGSIRTVESGKSITDAINIAVVGDTIIVKSGEYNENLVIAKPLTLIGIGSPVINGGYTGHVILITSPGTVVDGFIVRESGTRLIEDMACIRVEADSVTICNNIITEPLHGIYVKGKNNVYIHDNVISGRLDLISADRGNGIHVWNSKNNRIFNNEIYNVRDGIYFSFADSTKTKQNYIHEVRYGLHYMYSDFNHFVENRFENNVAGAALMYSKEIFFYRNIFSRCRGFRAYGILYQSMDNSVAVDNLIIDNSRGVFFDDSNHNVFRNNDVVDNDLAIQMNASSDENVIKHNNFIGNLSNLVFDGKVSRTAWGDEKGGNYWSDYRGYDLDGNGLGDVPHKLQNIFQIMENDVPQVRFYLFSPAAELLSAAERALPILDFNEEIDPDPLLKPISNPNIPWDEVKHKTLGSDKTSAMIYLSSGLIPFIVLLFVSRRQKGMK